MDAPQPQASYPCGNYSDTSTRIKFKTKESGPNAQHDTLPNPQAVPEKSES